MLTILARFVAVNAYNFGVIHCNECVHFGMIHGSECLQFSARCIAANDHNFLYMQRLLMLVLQRLLLLLQGLLLLCTGCFCKMAAADAWHCLLMLCNRLVLCCAKAADALQRLLLAVQRLLIDAVQRLLMLCHVC